MPIFRRFLSALALCSSMALAARTRSPLLIVGTMHLGNPGRDMNNVKVDDVLTPQHQVEVADIVKHLAAFKPTRIAVEASPSRQAEFDKRYAEYRAGKYSLTRDERDQIGLRLAAMLNLRGVDCVDYTAGPPGPSTAYDFAAYAAANGQQPALDAVSIEGKAMATGFSTFMSGHTLLEDLQYLNEPRFLRKGNDMYFRFAAMGGGDNYAGANWVGGWHARNMIIVENVRRAITPGDRVVLLFGSGHAYLLKEFALDSGAFDVANTEQYLH